MSPLTKKRVAALRVEIVAVLGQSASELFLRRIDTILEDCSAGKDHRCPNV